MGDKTSIEWTDATWNPVTGCTKVSAGCDHCYAQTMHERFNGPGSFDTVTLHPERLSLPLRWRKPRRVFVNSMSDLFHQDVPDEHIAEVWAAMAHAYEHTFQVLTKRHARMRSLLNSDRFHLLAADAYERRGGPFDAAGPGIMLPNVWLGVSVETQQWADARIPALLDAPAAVRFVSAEPLLGPVDLARWVPSEFMAPAQRSLDWVIAGGESGPGARPMHPDWARSLRDQCVSAGVPFLFKQWGAWAPTRMLGLGTSGDPCEICVPTSLNPKARPHEGEWLRRMGKRSAGRELDGRTWDEMPVTVAAGC